MAPSSSPGCLIDRSPGGPKGSRTVFHCRGSFSFILSSSCFSCHRLISLITSCFSYHVLHFVAPVAPLGVSLMDPLGGPRAPHTVFHCRVAAFPLPPLPPFPPPLRPFLRNMYDFVAKCFFRYGICFFRHRKKVGVPKSYEL